MKEAVESAKFIFGFHLRQGGDGKEF